jgi:hypothetical protein
MFLVKVGDESENNALLGMCGVPGVLWRIRGV